MRGTGREREVPYLHFRSYLRQGHMGRLVHWMCDRKAAVAMEAAAARAMVLAMVAATGMSLPGTVWDNGLQQKP